MVTLSASSEKLWVCIHVMLQFQRVSEDRQDNYEKETESVVVWPCVWQSLRFLEDGQGPGYSLRFHLEPRLL